MKFFDVKKKAILGIVLVMTILLSGCEKPADKKDEAKSTDEAAKEKQVFAVNTMITGRKNMDAYLEFGGDVEAASSVDVLPDTAGRLTRFYVSVGDYVRKDQVIADVDPSRAGMTYSISQVKAPISGTVTQLPYSIGSMVASSMSIGKVSSTGKLEIKMSVAERFISRIALNQRAYISFDAYPSEDFAAKVVRVSPILDNSTRTMNVTLQLDPPDSRIKVGMYARIKLITDRRKDVISIPYTGLVTRSDETIVYTVDAEGTVSRKVVKVGIRVDDKVEILEGLSVGDEIVVKGQTLLEEGSKVNVISRVDEDGVNVLAKKAKAVSEAGGAN